MNSSFWLSLLVFSLPLAAILSVPVETCEPLLLTEFFARIVPIPLLIALGVAAERYAPLSLIGIVLLIGFVSSIVLSFVPSCSVSGIVFGSALRFWVVPGISGLLGVYVGCTRVLPLIAFLTGISFLWSLVAWSSVTVAMTTVAILIALASVYYMAQFKFPALILSLDLAPPPAKAGLELSHYLALVAVILEHALLPCFDFESAFTNKRVFLTLEVILGFIGLGALAVLKTKWMPLILVFVGLWGAAFIVPGLAVTGWVFVALVEPALHASALIVGLHAFAPNRRAVGTLYLLSVHQVFAAIVIGAKPSGDTQTWCQVWIGILALVFILVWRSLYKESTPEVDVPLTSRPSTPKSRQEDTGLNTPVKSWWKTLVKPRPSTPRVTRPNTPKAIRAPSIGNISPAVIAIPSNIPILFIDDV